MQNEGKDYVRNWLFKRTLEDLDQLLDLTPAEKQMELKQARSLVVLEKHKAAGEKLLASPAVEGSSCGSSPSSTDSAANDRARAKAQPAPSGGKNRACQRCHGLGKVFDDHGGNIAVERRCPECAQKDEENVNQREEEILASWRRRCLRRPLPEATRR